MRTPLPNEIVKFTDSGFTFYTEGQPTTYGNYAHTTGQVCGGSTPVPGIRLAYVNANSVPQHVVVTVDGNKLVLDYGGPCDAPVDTYERLR